MGGCRTISGLAQIVGPEEGSPLKLMSDKAPEVMKNLAMARRTHRWCKEFPVIMGIPKSLDIPGTVDRILDLVQKIFLASFMIIDHIGWLKQVKVVTGGKRTAAETIQLGLKCLFVSNAIAAIVGVKKFHDLPVGLCGVASSYIDTMKVWPELKK